MELSKRFEFKIVDAKWSKVWVDQNFFHAESNSSKKPYTIMIPPPNVTGILHMGHALNNTLQDIIIRYKRMNGFEACWMPGADHAGIATQNVVEKQLAQEGKRRHDLGREKFLERTWEWKEKYGSTITHQLKQLGASCDWQRERFTMDEDYSNAVKFVFVNLYEKGLVYQGNRIINWCPRCQTALSDEEAEHKDIQGTLTHIQYPLKNNPNKFVVVATTRPETMLGDAAVAVNPADERYKDVIGQTLILPLMNREIPVIADELVSMEFGTGAVKVTPAHDPNDFEMGVRHNLKFINVMHPNGKINELGGRFNGLDRFEARKQVVAALKEEERFVKQDVHAHAVGHCYRCHTVVEPYLSKQWFVKMAPLAKPALKAVVDGDIKFYPDRWTKVYTNWMENIRDWCISRQIWWGHRIPVWYCVSDDKGTLKCPDPIVAMAAPVACPRCGSTHLKQDEDVLDTWFSSWLWPFATFNWPQKNPDLNYFYPTQSLLTASEIIFFWVARMIMAGYEFMGEKPFSEIYIHGTVRDTKGRKMSKSLGNAIDPLEIIDEFGADALRFSLIVNSGQDLFIDKHKFEIGRNFANKIWNASRLILMNVDEKYYSLDFQDIHPEKCADETLKWIISRYFSTLKEVSSAIEEFRFSEAENFIYEFFWNNFCDWYLENVKTQWSNEDVQKVSVVILKNALKMMHPFIPFVTEELWQQIVPKDKALSLQAWPQLRESLINKDIEERTQLLTSATTAIRNIRAEKNIKPSEIIKVDFVEQNPQTRVFLNSTQGVLAVACKIDVTISDQYHGPKDAIMGFVGSTQYFVHLNRDVEGEKKRLRDEILKFQKVKEAKEKLLSNEQFVAKAPEKLIQNEKKLLEQATLSIEEYTKKLDGLK